MKMLCLDHGLKEAQQLKNKKKFVLECGCVRGLDIKPEVPYKVWKDPIRVVDEPPESAYCVDWWKRDDIYPQMSMREWRKDNRLTVEASLQIVSYTGDFIPPEKKWNPTLLDEIEPEVNQNEIE